METARIGRRGWIQIDANDPERLAAWWTVLLGGEDVEAATSGIVGLGGRRRRPDADFNEYGYWWRTMADPEIENPSPNGLRDAPDSFRQDFTRNP